MKAYLDTFAHQLLPQEEYLPQNPFLNQPPFLQPDTLNCVERLLDIHIKNGLGHRICLQNETQKWTYQDLYEKANQIAHVLVDDLGLQSGNRVLLRSANNPMMVACWFAVLKAGGIVVATMPLLRAKELNTIIDCAEISHVLCDARLCDDLIIESEFLTQKCLFDGTLKQPNTLEALMERKPKTFDNFQSFSTNIAIIGFTSGTTGIPKMTAHYHRDIINICEAFPVFSLQAKADDVFTGSPPIGFTFGLGGLVLFPLYVGASSFLIEKPSPEALLEAIEKYHISICFTAPTAWRILNEKVEKYDISSLRKCVSAGESLPVKVWEDWYKATGLKIIDGIGATEMLHIFIASNDQYMKAGATGVPITGYEATILDENGKELPPNTIGKLAVKGITGCKYLNRIEKQKEYVQKGWNITGDLFKRDEDGFFWFIARGDDMIISSGYNIAAIEVESVLLMHEAVLECAVVGLPDANRGKIISATIVLKNEFKASIELEESIKQWFKEVAAPYKYPRIINFVDKLPKTETGKIQRFKLK